MNELVEPEEQEEEDVLDSQEGICSMESASQ
jgi:hypothetical protein